MTLSVSFKNLLVGLIFVGIGIAFGYAASGYAIGTLLRMGPGYFPLILAAILILLGGTIFVQALFSGPDEVAIGRIPWFGIFLLCGALIFFGLTVRGLGLMPSLFITVFLSAFASSKTNIVSALVMAALMTALCMVIFVWALGLPLPMLGPWLPL